ncbi:MAG: hypothetical protein H0V44_07665 [Planctomycetes bacterium]|nr:hypothetical protein [Planctomycetota bacterium]
MTTIRLLSSQDVPWTFIDCQHRVGDELAVAVSRSPTSPSGWWSATVPGMATQDLIRHGRIPDPFYADNRSQALWIEQRDVVYRTTFMLTAEEVATPCRLTCVSLDTFAVVVLNGEVVARHENQFRRLVVELTGRLRPGANHLAIAFEASYPATVRRAGPRLPFWNEPWERLYVRKSQMSFGWDWAARTPTVGIVDPIFLEFADGPWVGDLHLQGKPGGDGSGTIHASVDLQPAASGAGQLDAELVIDGTVVATRQIDAASAASVAFSHRITDARLWWAAELGEPHLYRVEIRLSRGKTVVHSAVGRCGIRDVRLVLEDAASPNGKVFYLSVNGKRLWAKGDNWLPIDFLHTRVTREQYRGYLALLMAGGVNCIRVWGGGIIEHAAFYELCDEMGLLIWHDFGFACGVYPNDAAFLAEVERETVDIVNRLRSHPSIALWCGNNENEPLVMSVNGTDEQRFHPLYYRVIPGVLARLDPDRPYHPGSPSSPSGKTHPDSAEEGDRHNWDVWFGWKSTDVITDDARFNSEFGAQSFPQRESLESFIPPDELWTQGAVSHPNGPSPGYLFARHGAQFDKLIARGAAFGKPNTLDALIATTQAFQADTVGRYVRHYRRLLPVTGGVVLWNYTATWPSICWAAVDFYRRPKQAYYECKRAFRPAVVGIEPVDAAQSTYSAHASVDRPGLSVRGEVVLELREVASGRVVASDRSTITVVGPAASVAATIALPAGLDRRAHALVARWTHADGVESDIRYLVPVAEVVGIGGQLTITRHPDRIEVQSAGWRMRVGIEGFETPSVWDDNYVDLIHGERRTLRIVHGRMPDHLWVVADMGSRKALPMGTTTI